MNPFLDSTDIAHDAEQLHDRMQRDGHLFFRGLLPREVLETPRLMWLELLRNAGCVDREAPLEEGLADMSGFRLEPEDAYMRVLADLYGLPAFHAVQHHPVLVSLIERMVGERVLPHPGVIGRYIFPQKIEFTTPPHQDFVPIQGTAKTYTAWVPFSDLSPDMGGLAICGGSHRGGVYRFRPALGAGALEVVDELPDDWRNGPVGQGDVLVFHSMTVHKGMPNTSRRMRLSMDARYSAVSEPIAEKSLSPHCWAVADWARVYANWPEGAKPDPYYWKSYDVRFVDYDNSYFATRDELAFDMAQAGDPRAYSTLQRIVARDSDEGKRDRARRLMAELEAIK
jgi:hypothetical protein